MTPQAGADDHKRAAPQRGSLSEREATDDPWLRVARRDMPDDDCDVKISSSEGPIVEAAAVHVVTHHGRADAPELRDEVRTSMKPEAGD